VVAGTTGKEGTVNKALHRLIQRRHFAHGQSDLERGMVHMATGRAEREKVADRVELTVADLADLPLPDDSVDLIVSTASMHHWTDVGAVIASLDRVLRPRGRMWIYDLRWVSAASVRAASAGRGRCVDRALVRTGWFPAALFQRLAIEPA
jgi:ubiquinone/menaquinone biosynthesis C-methylase UbiE